MRSESELLNFYNEAQKIMLSLGYPAERVQGGTIKLNGRLSRTLGRNFYQVKRTEIQKEYFYHADSNSLMNTIVHELAHQVNTHKDGHGRHWLEIADHISKNTPYHITQYASADKLEYRKESNKYVPFKCSCSEHQIKTNKNKTISDIELYYTCKKCGSRLKHIG